MNKLAFLLAVTLFAGSGAALTVGVEEEFMLLDRASLDLVQGIERILALEKRGAKAWRNLATRSRPTTGKCEMRGRPPPSE